ncbi:DNA alkylation repair protein [Phenylobacterium sp. LH3H17]|uniref:DNA alkylation repair protein n=1 Tax=Phenylobacterium sp. LH3H17 TaxID=2903901 RepID=UPI0020C93DDF|nr:DNA alkylation repair protein [Phenylobacterium sp. LH3H17]UTP38746.1 DNA alkylation repair protein [Phenylobacterium sp. LH3H17]
MATLDDEVAAALEALRARATNHDRENMARFGIEAPRAFGVSMANLQKIAKPIGRRHDLAQALWETGWYEARMLASLIDDPAQVTPRQMDLWCADFDNWGIVDTVCFKLFDQAPDAFDRLAPWAERTDEFQKRAAFALLASLALHGKGDGDEPFRRGLVLIEAAAGDDRNFVKKGVSWALRAIGGKRSPALKAAALEAARRLAASSDPAARWIGKDALRDLTRTPKPRRTPAAKTEELQ